MSTFDQAVSDYKYLVLYERFCTKCGEPGHNLEDCFVYKTTLCKYWKSKKCLNANCTFAHGPWELRKPQKSKCARVFEIAPKTFVVRGCGERNTHTYNDAGCPKGLLLPPVPPAPTNQ